MAQLNTPIKTGSYGCPSSVASMNSINHSSQPTTPYNLPFTPVTSPVGNAYDAVTATPTKAQRSTLSPCKVTKALSTGCVSPMRSRTLFPDAKLEIANMRIVKLREEKYEAETTIANLRRENEQLKEAASVALTDKDNELKLLKSKAWEMRLLKANAWEDELQIQQKNEEIADLRRRLAKHTENSNKSDNEALKKEAQELQLSIVDLSLVKKELQEEIQALEIHKEGLEFA